VYCDANHPGQYVNCFLFHLDTFSFGTKSPCHRHHHHNNNVRTFESFPLFANTSFIMALTPQAARTLKLFTAVATVGVGIQAMFFSEYNIDGFEGKDHIFTDVQKDARNWIDQNIYGIDAASMRRNTTDDPSKSKARRQTQSE
jgi:hypothetical protein